MKHKDAWKPILVTLVVVAAVILFFYQVSQQSTNQTPEMPLFINKTSSQLLLATHELPKYRPPDDWDQMLKGPLNLPVNAGALDGTKIVFQRRMIENNTIKVVESVSQNVYIFDTRENAIAFKASEIERITNETYSVVYAQQDAASCTVYYSRGRDADKVEAPCDYANTVIVYKIYSALLNSREYLTWMLNVTEKKYI